MPYISPNLKRFENKFRSQFGEDGVLIELARCLGIAKGTFFEFGIGPAFQQPIEAGLEGNCVYLKELGWHGVFLDGGEYPAEYEVRREYITAMNINDLYRKHNVDKDLDIISIDVDGQEFWIWMALQYNPKIVIIEYNGALDIDVSVTMPFKTDHVWNGLSNNNSSLLALTKLGNSKQYALVWSNGVNAIFLRKDQINNVEDFVYNEIYTKWELHPFDPQAVWIPI